MNEFLRALSLHIARYPAMQPQDAVKLAYQAEFGCAHLLSDANAARELLYTECAMAAQHAPVSPLCELIGGGFVRINLASLSAGGVTPERLLCWFCASAAHTFGSDAGLDVKLEALRARARLGAFEFNALALEEYIAAYTAMGRPAVSHSARYKALYSPAYRVVQLSCCDAPLKAE